jgi:hypothetical protein
MPCATPTPLHYTTLLAPTPTWPTPAYPLPHTPTGVDPHELIDTRPLLYAMNAMITGNGEGREELGNMPRKLNICISSTRDDFPHTHINDVGFEAVHHPESGEVVFNVVIGGYFSIKRNIVSLPLDCSVTQEQLLPFVDALLRVFRWGAATGAGGSGAATACARVLLLAGAVLCAAGLMLA